MTSKPQTQGREHWALVIIKFTWTPQHRAEHRAASEMLDGSDGWMDE